MYKTQIKRWGLDKKNKEFEMRAIVRKNGERADQGKRSIFLVRGQIRDFTDVVRYWDRKGVSIDDLITRQTPSPTPEAVGVFTPISSPIVTPQVLAIPERMLRCIRDYFRGSFESGAWVKTDPLCRCYSIKNGENAAEVPMDQLIIQCLLACSLFERNLFREAGQTMIAATAKSKTIVLEEHPESLADLFHIVTLVRQQKRAEMALSILRQLAALSKVLLGGEHPLSRICEWANTVYTSEFDDVAVRCMEVMADQFESFVGPMHDSTLSMRVKLINMVQEGNTRTHMVQNLLGECEKTLPPYDGRVMWIRTVLAFECFDGSYYVEAWTLSQRNIACSQGTPSLRKFYEENLAMVARCQYAVGDVDSGIVTLHKAIDSRMSRCGLQDHRARTWLVELEDMYLEQGLWSSAAQVREWREKILESMDKD